MRLGIIVAFVLIAVMAVFGCRDSVDSGTPWTQHADYLVGGTLLAIRDSTLWVPDSLVIAFNDSIYTMTSSGAWSIHVENMNPFLVGDDPGVGRLRIYDFNTWNLQEKDSFYVADTTYLIEMEQIEQGYGDWYLGLYRNLTMIDTLKAYLYPELVR